VCCGSSRVIGKNLFLSLILDLCLVEQLWLKGTLHTYELGLPRQNHQNIVGGVDAKVALYSSSCHYVFLEFTRDRYEAAFFPLLIGYVTRHAPGPSASILNCNTLCLRFKELLLLFTFLPFTYADYYIDDTSSTIQSYTSHALENMTPS
jgi:hypothetical protein